jgi:hypothetical protein
LRPVKTALGIALLFLLAGGIAYASLDDTIDQSNIQDAYAGGVSGSVTQNAANYGVVYGQGNHLSQENLQDVNTTEFDIKERATNIALVIGESNSARQINDPAAVDIQQLNELMMIGTENKVRQSNKASMESWSLGAVVQDQTNFGVVFGDSNRLNQTNKADAVQSGTENISQTAANAGYIYGLGEKVSQKNDQKSQVADACGAFTNQTAKNLAFAITSWTVAEYIPPSDVFMMIPEGNFSLQIPIMPGIPDLPAPPALETEFPMDP